MKNRITKVVRRWLLCLLMSATPLFAQDNLIPNGSFLQPAGPNQGYLTDYQFSWSLYGDGDVGKYCQCGDAQLTSSSMFHFPDHTVGNYYSDYLVANGATNANMRVWYATVNVTPHSYYDFSLWITNLSYGGGYLEYMRSKLKIKFNNVVMVENYVMPNVSTSQGIWNQLPTVHWYSNNSSTVLIEIFDNCTVANGNDFGLDDITMFYMYSNVVTPVVDNVSTCFEQSVNFDPFANDYVNPPSIRPDVDCSIVSLPQHGSLDWVYGTTWTYIPNTGFSGTDQLTYKLTYGTNDIVEYGTVNFTVNPRPQRVIEQHACESFTWTGGNGQTYTQSGQYQYVKPNPSGCDSLLILNLTIHHGEEVTLPAVEECDEYIWHGTTYTQSGTYDYQTTTQWGCIRIEHLPLTIHYSDTVDTPISTCDSYTWYGQTYTQSGVYTHNSTNSFGCDRLERLYLTISDEFRHVDTRTECDEYYWPRKQQWYYQNAMDSITVPGPNGCDSTFVLDLTIHYGDTIDLEPVSACDSYEWHGQNYTTSGIKTFLTTNEYGCDRLERLDLTIHNSENIELPAATECDEFLWHGQTYTQSGVIVFDTVNQYGCPLQYTLPLTINYSDTLTWDPVSECDSYVWYGQTITESGLYTHMSTTPEGCDRLERIYVTINYSTVDTLAPVTACDSYEWHGQEYSQTGYYTYEGVGPTGCPHTEVLLLTVNHSSENEFNVIACESYTWYDSTYTEPGEYYHVLTNSQGCDSLLVMHLELGETFELEESATGCESYEWHGQIYYENGDYTDFVEDPSGCDSLFILHLTIAPNYEEEMEAEACYFYTWVDETYQQSGDYERHFVAQSGCDSLVVLHLTIKEAVYHEFEQQTCLPFTWNDITYYTDGDYEQTFDAYNGCDSIVTMHLVFRDALTSEFDRTACDTITWENQICDHDGDYFYTYQSQQGCDSIVTMHFTMADEIIHEFDTVACETFSWFEYEYITNGMVCSHKFQTPMGCDSVVIKHVYLNVTEVNTQFIPACDTYEYNGVIYDEPGIFFIGVDTVFSQYGCDSIVNRIRLEIKDSNQIGLISGLSNVYVSSNLVSGIYRYEIDPDEIQGDVNWSLSNADWQIWEAQDNYCRVLVTTPGTVTLTASFRTPECGEIVRAFEINAGFFGVGEQALEVNVFPNPTKGTVTVEAEGIESVRLTDMMGQVLEMRHCDHSDSILLNLNGYTPSVYLLEIKTINGTVKKRLVLCR